MSKIRILLAEDHRIMLEGLRLLINTQADMEVIGQADNGQKAVVLTQKLQPDIVVMDISMPELNGLKATEKLLQLYPRIKILALTRHTDGGYLEQILRAGASGYLLKQSAAEELVRAIRAVVAGQVYLDPAMTDHLVTNVIGRYPARGPARDQHLSPREEEVLRCIGWGFLSKEIAERLQLSIKTVEAHKAHAMQKLGMKSRIEIVRYAVLRGWLLET
jgi:two-component system response regulator NreC